MLHKLKDLESGAEIISDDQWLPIYQKRKTLQYLGEIEETAPEAVADDTQTKSKKAK